MEQQSEQQQKFEQWLTQLGIWLNKSLQRLWVLLQRLWRWYQSINWPEIPLSAFQLLMLFYVIFGILFLLATPIFEASDELWHFGMVEYLRDHDGALPEHDVSVPDRIYENNRETTYRQEGSQPPLYYYTMALLTQPFDLSNVDQYRQPNPHVRAGIPGNWGNKNLMLHQSGLPHDSTALAIFLMRALGIAMGCVTIWAVFEVGVLLAPHRPVVGLLAGALTAFNPMFLFISASVNNDTMVIMLCSVVILLALQTLRDGFDRRRSLLLALLLALATLTKLSALVLVPVIALAALWVARRDRNWSGLLLLGAVILVAWATIAGWWYWRNWQLYGELFGTQTMAAVAGLRLQPYNFMTFLSEFQGFRQGYWGVFGAFNIITSPIFYILADFVVFLGAFGVLFLVAQLLSIQDFGFARRELSLVLFLLSILLVGFVAYLNWTSLTYASQGRLLFPFFAAISPLLAVGLIEVLWWLLFLLSPPDRSFVQAGNAVPEPILRQALQWPLRLFGLLVCLIPLFTIMPQYQAPQSMTMADIPETAESVYARFGNVELVAYERVDRRYLPTENVPVTLYWRVLEPTTDDLSLALAFVNPYGARNNLLSARTIATYPGSGTLRTSTWQKGAVYADTYHIPLVRNISAQSPFVLEINWYDASPEDRIAALNDANNPITVLLNMGAIVNPNLRVSLTNLKSFPMDETRIERNFGNEILLRAYGYNIQWEDLNFSVDVLWESQNLITEDYITLMHIYDAQGTLIAQDDLAPQLPTTYWRFRDDFRMTYTVRQPQAGFEPGEYSVNVGWYKRSDPSQRLILQQGVTDKERDTYPLFTFSVDDQGTILLPVLDLDDSDQLLQDAPPPPSPDADVDSETDIPTPEFIRIEATPELTPEINE